jgi:hypothetical protein
MTNIYDNDILITQTSEHVFIDLVCGFGQPCVTTIYLKKNDGTTLKLDSFDMNLSKHDIGSIESLRSQTIEIYTSIEDRRVINCESEETDISLNISVYQNKSNLVDTGFVRKTKGTGSIIHSFYLVTIL